MPQSLFAELTEPESVTPGPRSGIDKLLATLEPDVAADVRNALLARKADGDYVIGPVILSRRLKKRGWAISDLQIIRYRNRNGHP